ncbi:MAG: DNA polymerase III subunit delta [Bacteroidales bacterium]|nr:DNA polymerase III subunit delta [Bacteroidales bacterium]
MLFTDIIGQDNTKQRLIQTVKDGRISHAQLFLGPEGCGKLALALAYAQYISCENKGDHDSCGTCASCKKYQKLIHPDLHFVFPVASAKSGNQKPVSDDFINEWRQSILDNPYIKLNQWFGTIGVENKQGSIYSQESGQIIKKMNLKTFESEYKIMIIWMPEKMNISAANKLLKMIEEPPAKTLFLLVSENAGKIIQTIRSRTQLVKIPKIDDENLSIALKNKFDLDENKISDIAHLSNGNYAKAVEVINSDEENQYNFNCFKTLTRLCYKADVLELVKFVDIISKIGREKQKNFISYSIRMMRENFILNKNKPEITYLTNEENNFSQKFNTFVNERNIMKITREFNQSFLHIERNGNSKIIFLDLSLKLIKLLKL